MGKARQVGIREGEEEGRTKKPTNTEPKVRHGGGRRQRRGKGKQRAGNLSQATNTPASNLNQQGRQAGQRWHHNVHCNEGPNCKGGVAVG